jgi:N-dimethylarginine dimethylaminohydrolase
VITDQIRVHVDSEYGELRDVVMCLAQPMQLTWGYLRALDVATLHQLRTNRWRPYDHRVVWRQQETVIGVLEEHGATVHVVEGTSGDIGQHYTRDIGFAIDDTFFVARPRRLGRQRELVDLRPLVGRLSRVRHLDWGTIEGGDVMLHDRHVLVGLGEETHPAGVEALTYQLRQAGSERQVVTLRFAHRGVIHLDTKLNIVGPGVAVVYPPAFTAQSMRWIERHFDLIVATRDETRSVAINTFSLGPRTVLMAEGSERLAGQVELRGLKPVLVDYSEVTKLPGSLRCTTLPLARVPGDASRPVLP